MTALDMVVRSALFAGVLLGLALVLASLTLRRRAGARHAVLMAALLLSAAAPGWLALAGRRPERSGAARVVSDPVEAALAPVLRSRPSAGAVAVDGGPITQPWLAVWSLGVLVLLARLGHGAVRSRALRRRALGGQDPGHERLVGQALEHAVRPLPAVLVSADVAAAVVVGVRRPVILVSPHLVDGDPEALAQVLAHELAHVRRQDTLWGALQQLVGALFWFHPVVHLASRAISSAREEACDDQVVARHARPDYARTLLALAGRVSDPCGAATAVALGRRRSAVERRIVRLLDAPVAARPAAVAAGALALVVVLMGVATPLARALAPRQRDRLPMVTLATSERPADAEEHRILARPGPETRGAFVLRDLRSNRVLLINPDLARERVTPASTFKVLIAAVGLERGVLADQHTVLRWDGKKRDMPGWNQDQDLATAMRTSSNWFFEEVVRRLPAGALAGAVTGVGYGNQDTSWDATRFSWVLGALRISALEQVAFMSRLAERDLPFSRRSLDLVDEVTTLERRGTAVMHGKTGTAVLADEALAWLVGYVDDGGPAFAFATLLRAPPSQMSALTSHRVAMTKALLERHHALPPSAAP
jgi:bla regulator protein blaR1